MDQGGNFYSRSFHLHSCSWYTVTPVCLQELGFVLRSWCKGCLRQGHSQGFFKQDPEHFCCSVGRCFGSRTAPFIANNLEFLTLSHTNNNNVTDHFLASTEVFELKAGVPRPRSAHAVCPYTNHEVCPSRVTTYKN